MASTYIFNPYRKESTRFDGTNYKIWEQMKIQLRCLGAEVWEIKKKGYTPHDPNFRTSALPDEQKGVDNDVRVKEAL